jgi:ribosomal protein S18 acetylase RimI-like enzyme
MKSPVELRPARDSDMPFLYTVYASTRENEMRLVDWDEETKEKFLRMQFDAQHTFYHEQFPDAEYAVILRSDEPIGRLYVHRRTDEIRIVDIALLAKHRNDGIGTSLMRSLMDEAVEGDKPLRIHVERFNPALGLYKRLGFVEIGDTGVYLLMEWTPTSGDREKDNES